MAKVFGWLESAGEKVLHVPNDVLAITAIIFH
jgi:hypothetical protein